VVYDTRARVFVSAWKEGGRRDLARVAAQLVAEVVPPPDSHVLAFVPADRDRGLRRGHSPTERLARELSVLWGVEVVSVLRRTRSLPRQRGLGLADRRRNVAGAFTAAAAVPARVCLVDDVYTSGATANACASALRRAGARYVEVVSLARAVR
jgi:predicted amidophosphoribosyltransferase